MLYPEHWKLNHLFISTSVGSDKFDCVCQYRRRLHARQLAKSPPHWSIIPQPYKSRNLHASHLRKVINLQNRIVRIIFNAEYRDSADPLYNSLGLLKLVDIDKYLIARFVFRYCNNNVPELFNSYFEYHTNHFYAPRVKTDLAKTGLEYRE